MTTTEKNTSANTRQHINQIDHRATLDDLRATILGLGPRVLQGELPPIHVTISGYDNDTRELWEIPEAVALCKRIIDSGLIAIMAVNFGKDRIERVWGSIDVWFVATRRMKAGRSTSRGKVARSSPITRADVEHFFCTVLAGANRKVDAMLKAVRAPISNETPEGGRYGRT